jgi:hypothetical protein
MGHASDLTEPGRRSTGSKPSSYSRGDGCIYPSDLPSQNKATRTYKRKEERSSLYTANTNLEARSYKQAHTPSACWSAEEVDERRDPGDCLEPRALRIIRWQAIRDDDIDAIPLAPRLPNPAAATHQPVSRQSGGPYSSRSPARRSRCTHNR